METIQVIIANLIAIYLIGVSLVLILFMLKKLFSSKEHIIKAEDFMIFFHMLKSWYHIPTAYKDFINEPKHSLMKIMNTIILSTITITIVSYIVFIVKTSGLSTYFVIFDNFTKEHPFQFISYVIGGTMGITFFIVLVMMILSTIRNKIIQRR